MAYEQRPGQFSLFKNEKTNPAWPDYKGDGMDLDGNPIWVSAWLKDGKQGKFMSCSFKLKTENPQRQAKPPMEDDPIPF